jgi:hypothetical protein
MCSVSRAAQVNASDGVEIAAASRYIGAEGSGEAAGSGSSHFNNLAKAGNGMMKIAARAKLNRL